jgi:hypothetical protein
MQTLIPWIAVIMFALLWLRTANVHTRLARIERALAPGVKHEVRRG